MRPPAQQRQGQDQLILAHAQPDEEAETAAALTANSLVSIEPMILRGGIRPSASRTGVATEPQPPPPVASTNPATRPSGTRS